MEEPIKYCLFCQERIIPYSLSLPPRSEEEERDYNDNYETPNFWRLCKFLSIKFTTDCLKQLKSTPRFIIDGSVGSLLNGDLNGRCESCDKFLCLSCFEAVDNLNKLYMEVESIQKKIVGVTKAIRELISGKNCNSLGVTSTILGEGKRRNVRDLEFVELFQKLVKESQDCSQEMCKGYFIDAHSQERISKIVRRTLRTRKDPTDKKRISKQNEYDDLIVPKVELDGENEDSLIAAIKTEVDHDLQDDYSDDPTYLPLDDLGNFDDQLYHDEDGVVTTDVSVALEAVEETDQTPTKSITESKTVIKKCRRLKRTVPSDATISVPFRRKKKRKASTSRLSKFSCRRCPATFPTRLKYLSHQKMHSPLTAKSLGIPIIYETENDKRTGTHVCTICGYKVKHDRLGYFMEHMLSHELTADPSSTPNPCDQCEKTFLLKLNLDLHKICIHDWKHVILKCDFCGSTSSKTREELVAHLNDHNGGIRVHMCKSCPMVCTTLDKLLEHMLKHRSSKRLLCPECDEFVTPSPKELYLHCNKVHPELKKKFDCHLCEKSFIIPVTLRNHLRQNHGLGAGNEGNPRTGDLRCPKCTNGHIYKSKASLDGHLARYHTDADKLPFKCEQCDKSFIYKSLLQNHIDEKHNRTRYPCPHCSKTYLGQHHLGVHIRTHTGEGLFTCDMCGKQFPSNKQLKIHSIVHLEKTEENCCVCEICGKKFSNNLHLRKHKNSHKEKNLECEYCHMKFRRPDHLRGHLRTHTGERPFICPICSKGFNRRDIMIVHMKIHGLGQEEAGRVYNSHLEGTQNLMKNELKK